MFIVKLGIRLLIFMMILLAFNMYWMHKQWKQVHKPHITTTDLVYSYGWTESGRW